MSAPTPLLRVCQLLNEAGARYLICGAHACMLPGLVRTTEDVDILVEASEENCRRVIDGLARLEDGAARELTPKDILENVVVKVADEVEVDVSTHAWKVTYDDAIGSARETVIEGVRLPFLGLASLMASKETYHGKNAWDRAQAGRVEEAIGLKMDRGSIAPPRRFPRIPDGVHLPACARSAAIMRRFPGRCATKQTMIRDLARDCPDAVGWQGMVHVPQ